MDKNIKQKGKLIIFSAPSGAGKTTIVKYLLTKGLGLEFSISATSREKRHTETHGEDYYFLSDAGFREKVKNDEFLEWEEVFHGSLYGTLKSEVERIRNLGKNVIFDVDVVGGLNIKRFYGNEALSVFVRPPSVAALKERLTARSTETEEKIKARIAKAKYEMAFADRFDVILVNENLEEAFAEAEKLVAGFLGK